MSDNKINQSLAELSPSCVIQQDQPQHQHSNSRNLQPQNRVKLWADDATAKLIETWGQQYLEANMGRLNKEQWERVDASFANDNPPITLKQCKYRIDTINKKHKIEGENIDLVRKAFYDQMNSNMASLNNEGHFSSPLGVSEDNIPPPPPPPPPSHPVHDDADVYVSENLAVEENQRVSKRARVETIVGSTSRECLTNSLFMLCKSHKMYAEANKKLIDVTQDLVNMLKRT